MKMPSAVNQGGETQGLDNLALRSRFRGSLLGLALGDAIGAAREGGGLAPTTALAVPSGPLRYTDDAHMAMGLAQSLVACRGLEGEHLARAWARRWREQPWRGYGLGPPRLFRLIEGGARWDEAAHSLYGGGSYGNGAAMRVAPIGLLYHHDPARLREGAETQALITHAHPLGKEGAVLEASAVALALGGDTVAAPIEPGAFLAKLRGLIREEAYLQRLQAVERLLAEDDRRLVVAALWNGVAALDSVPTAVLSFLRHPQDFAGAVGYAVSLGGDTDTIAAMAGAISGAYLGEEGLPTDWVARLEDAGELARLGDGLWELHMEGIR